jgi:DNA-binding GntR family transcriptional regulator
MNGQKPQLDNAFDDLGPPYSDRATNGSRPNDPKRSWSDTVAIQSNSTASLWAANVGGERTLADRAYAAIQSAILDGSLRPGDRLRIEDLSATLHISPTPIREALSRLEAAGLAEYVAHRGSRVSEVSASEFRELYELRFILEPLAVSKAAERFNSETARSARGHLERMQAALGNGSLHEAWEAHTAFHFTLYQAAGSRWLDRLITPLWDSCRRYGWQQNNLRSNPLQNKLEHEKILNACVGHDPKAAALELYNHTARNANIIAKATFGESFFEPKAS